MTEQHLIQTVNTSGLSHCSRRVWDVKGRYMENRQMQSGTRKHRERYCQRRKQWNREKRHLGARNHSEENPVERVLSLQWAWAEPQETLSRLTALAEHMSHQAQDESRPHSSTHSSKWECRWRVRSGWGQYYEPGNFSASHYVNTHLMNLFTFSSWWLRRRQQWPSGQGERGAILFHVACWEEDILATRVSTWETEKGQLVLSS